MKILFEGFYDLESGWEFDLPCYLMKPIIRLYHTADIDNIIEDFLVDYAIDGKFPDSSKAIKVDGKLILYPYLERTCKRYFSEAKKGRARKGIVYFSATATFDENKIINENYNWDDCKIVIKEII